MKKSKMSPIGGQKQNQNYNQEEWQSTSDVLIVGAGYTGLSAALTLLKSGLR